jgi:hypothetical protein
METTVGATQKILKSLTILTMGGLFLGAGFTPGQKFSSGKAPAVSPLSGNGGETILLAEQRGKGNGKPKRSRKNDISGTEQEVTMTRVIDEIHEETQNEIRRMIQQENMENVQENRIIPLIVAGGVGTPQLLYGVSSSRAR